MNLVTEVSFAGLLRNFVTVMSFEDAKFWPMPRSADSSVSKKFVITFSMYLVTAMSSIACCRYFVTTTSPLVCAKNFAAERSSLMV